MIGVALADQLNKDVTTTVAVVETIDIDPVAIEVSMENAKQILGLSSQQDCCYKATLCTEMILSPVLRIRCAVVISSC